MNGIFVNMEDVIFSYKKNTPILNGLTMQVPKNSIFAILGHNGAGKTTLDLFKNIKDSILIAW